MTKNKQGGPTHKQSNKKPVPFINTKRGQAMTRLATGICKKRKQAQRPK